MTEAEPDDRDRRLGSQVDRYEIVRLLGKGGMGAVYEARHLRLARRVAIKFLLPELAARAEILRRFENEAVAAGGLEHPNLVAVIDLGRGADGAPYLVMEFLPGEDCARLLRRVGPLPVARAVNIALQACRGVAVAHDAGIVHRDLKPENLFLTDVGDGSDQIKVLDFGIAKLRPVDGQAATRTGSTFGTTHYMSPEQARGASDVDARTDVWALGVVLYELLAGRKPFDGEQPLNVVHQILNASPAPLDTLRPGLPRGLVAAVDKAMRKDAGERFPTIRTLLSALAPFGDAAALGLDGSRVSATRPTPTTSEQPPGRRRAIGPAAGTALALAGIAVGIVAAKMGGSLAESPAPPVERPVAAAAAPVVPAAAAAPVAPPAAPAPPPAAVTAPAAAPAEVGKASEPSEQSGQPEVVHMAARRPQGSEGRRSGGAQERPSSKVGARPEAPKAPVLKLDPNPY